MKPADYRLYSSLKLIDTDQKRACIDLSALAHNYAVLRECFAAERPPRLIAVVKADAYGHGAPECVRRLLEAGCDFFAVSCIEEAMVVRKVTIETGHHADILILGYTAPKLVAHLSKNDFIQALPSPAYADALAAEAERAALTVRVHVAIDTGMNRIGYLAHSEEEIARATEDISAIFRNTSLKTEGMFTHFATADENTPAARARMQVQAERYRALRETLEQNGITIPFHHVCNSAASVSAPQLHFDGVRVGELLWGGGYSISPSLPLRPVMRLEADVSHIHTVLPGESISYGGIFTAERPMKVAVLPIGYADGWTRSYGKATVTLKTRTGSVKAPIIGRICMDQCMIDVTDTDAAVGDTATLFGLERRDLDTLATLAGTIDYECLCLISSRVKRTYLE